MNPSNDLSMYPRYTLGAIDVDVAVKGVNVGPARDAYEPQQLVAVRNRDGSPDVARVVEDWGRHVKVSRFSLYREQWLPAVPIAREEILGVSL